MLKSTTDVRDAFFDTLFEIATADRQVLMLSDDQGAFSLEKFKKELPDQYINIGIAEQNLIAVAAGLALEGKRPFVYGISTFVTMRCFEHLKVDLSCMKLPVTVIGSGAGYTYGSDGPTHHAVQDVAVIRTLPEMTIYNPADAVTTAATAHLAYRNSGPTYIRIEKGVLPALYESAQDFSSGFTVLKPGTDVVLIASGFMVHTARQVADALSKQNVAAGIIDLYRIKPVDAAALLGALKPAKRIVTLEEHSLIGGIGSLLCELLADTGLSRPLKRFGLQDRHCYAYGNREWLHTQENLTAQKLTTTLLEWISKKE